MVETLDDGDELEDVSVLDVDCDADVELGLERLVDKTCDDSVEDELDILVNDDTLDVVEEEGYCPGWLTDVEEEPDVDDDGELLRLVGNVELVVIVPVLLCVLVIEV